MDLWSKLKGEFVDIIEWTDSSQDTIVWRFPRFQNEIKMGAKLTVRESQAAVFVNEGTIADVFMPGMHTLQTQNMPILSTLKGWMHGFNSPFKAEVYFVNTKNFTDNKWGTKNPIMLRDAEFGPLRLRMFGTYAYKVTDPGKFVKEIAGTDAHFTVDEINEQLRNLAVTRTTDAIAQSKIPALDMAANYDELSKFVLDKINPEFTEYGLTLTKFLIENVSLPPEVEAMLDKRTSMGIIGDMGKFNAMQAGVSMEAAANNPGGDAASGVGLGMGFAMAQQMAGMFNQQATAQPQFQQSGQAGPPPLPGAALFYVAVNGQQTGPFDINTLRSMLTQGQFTAQSLVWKQGFAAWTMASQVPELSTLFGAMPPPPPPPM